MMPQVMTGWLEPLLARVSASPTTVVSPVIDAISEDTFQYSFQHYAPIGVFDWTLRFRWNTVSKREVRMVCNVNRRFLFCWQNKRRVHSWAPTHTPAIAGGLFSIDKDFFRRLGYYDPGFDIWGAENLELSFKTWMCGGTLEIIPCSHVGHVFR